MDTFLRLKRKRTVRRLIEGAVTVSSLTALIVLSVLKEKSKVVDTVGTLPFSSYESVRYTNDHPVRIMIFAMIFALFFSLLLADFTASRIYYRKIDGEDVIVYNGMGPIRLLVGGEEKDVMLFKGFLETRLKSGVKITVSPQFFMSYHITFSDDRPAIDL